MIFKNKKGSTDDLADFAFMFIMGITLFLLLGFFLHQSANAPIERSEEKVSEISEMQDEIDSMKIKVYSGEDVELTKLDKKLGGDFT
jgi:hypothetical protein